MCASVCMYIKFYCKVDTIKGREIDWKLWENHHRYIQELFITHCTARCEMGKEKYCITENFRYYKIVH